MKNLHRIMAFIICLALTVSLCACGGQEKKTSLLTDDESEHVELRWLVCQSEPKGFDEVIAAANEYLAEKLNVTLDLECIESGDYPSKVQLSLAAGEKLDIVWTSNWCFDYESNAAKGAFLALDEYLEIPELQGLKNYYKEGIWEATKVAGKIYGMPVEQIFHQQIGYKFHKDYVNKYGLEEKLRDIAWVNKDKHGSMEDLDEIFDIVRAGEPIDAFHIATGGFSTFETVYAKVADFNIIDGVVSDNYDNELVSAIRSRKWNEKGYFPADVATNDNLESLHNAGKVFTRMNRYLPGCDAKHLLSHDFEVITIPTGEAVINRSAIQTTLNAVSATCKNPVRALKLLYLMHQDEYLMNLLSYGLEGRDFTLDPENPKRMTRSSDGYYLAEFLIGSQFLCYLAPAYEDDVWEQTKYENETARIDDLIGFSFDPSSVESEMSQCSAVKSEYGKILSCGLESDPEAVMEEREKKLKLAGKQVVMEEAQRQLDEWMADNQ